MGKETAFDLLVSFANQKSKKSTPGLIDYLYGYAQFLGMKESVLKNILEQKYIDQYKNVVSVFEKKDIDISLIKQSVALLSADDSLNRDITPIIELLKQRVSGTNDVPIDMLLNEIVKRYQQVLDIFHKGNNLSDIISYQRENGVSKKPEREQSGTEEVSDLTEEETAMEETVSDEKGFAELSQKSGILYTTLKESIKGQDEAVRRFVEGYFQAELKSGFETDNKGLKGLFLFAGPPGVGKTFLAETAANILQIPKKRFNMSEYSDHQSPTELIGVSKKFAQGTPGELTSFVKDNPESILIFDEIEKAHLNVIHLFLQILDAGALQDSYWQENISFKDTIIIFTTNVGKILYEDARDQNLSLLSQSVILDALESERHPLTGNPLFPTAICSRFATGNVIMFNHLKCQHILEIVDKNFGQCAKLMKKKYNYELQFDKKLASLFLFHLSSNLDARIVTSQSTNFIQKEMYEFARLALGKADFKEIERVRFDVSYDNADETIQELFVKQKTDSILLFGNPVYAQMLSALDADVCVVNDYLQLQKTLSEKEFDIAIVDPLWGYDSGNQDYFSLEDYDSEGVKSFNYLRNSNYDLPIFIFEADQTMRDVDKNTFLHQGAHGIITCLDGDKIGLCKDVDEILDQLYLEHKVMELSKQEKVIQYNTYQTISVDKKTATIGFYDFVIQTAVKGTGRGSVLSQASRPDVTFDDVIGAENAKKELKFFCEYMRNPKEFMEKDFRPPKGILLYGPPGTGKTMLAKAMAGESDVTFLPVVATDFLDKYWGEGEKRVKELFKTAHKYAPTIIFIDEIDAIAKERTGGESTHTERLLNVFLTEMDGFVSSPKRPVFVVAATNFALTRSDSRSGVIIDPAFQRRFDNKIYVDLPNESERKEFLKKMFKAKKIDGISDGAIENIAGRTTGESLANLSNVIELAIRNAYREKTSLNDEILLTAMEEFFYGEKHEWGREYYESVAYHEVGHAYISYLSGVMPQFITIVSRGDFGGYMQGDSREKVPNYTKEDLLWRIRVCLAGRASEIFFFGEEKGINTGVASDLDHATNIAFNMLTRYGMISGSWACLSRDEIMKSAVSEKYLMEVQNILETEMEKTIQLIREGEAKIRSLVERLLKENQMVKEDIISCFQQ